MTFYEELVVIILRYRTLLKSRNNRIAFESIKFKLSTNTGLYLNGLHVLKSCKIFFILYTLKYYFLHSLNIQKNVTIVYICIT